VFRMSVGSWFQACGPVVENALEPNAVRDRGMSKRPSCAERRWRLPARSATGTTMSVKYSGACPWTIPCIKLHITAWKILCECNDTQYTLDHGETCAFYDCDRRRVPPGTCACQPDERHVSTIMLDWSEFMSGYNTADSAVRDRMTRRMRS